MSRSLDINLVKTKSVGGNKCMPLMNYIQAQGGTAILTTANIPALQAILDSLSDPKSDTARDIETAIHLLNTHGELEFKIVY